MRACLGFAIATSVDPDILLLDEVLATGDAEFREKSKARVIELVKAARDRARDPRHGLGRGVRNRAMLLEKGRVIIEGDPSEVVRTHMERSSARKAERPHGSAQPDSEHLARRAAMTTLRTVAASVARRLARVRPEIRRPRRRSPPATRTARSR